MAQVTPVISANLFLSKRREQLLEKGKRKTKDSTSFAEKLEEIFLEKHINLSKNYGTGIIIKKDYGSF